MLEAKEKMLRDSTGGKERVVILVRSLSCFKQNVTNILPGNVTKLVQRETGIRSR